MATTRPVLSTRGTVFINPLDFVAGVVVAGALVAGVTEADDVFVKMAASGEFGAKCSSSTPTKNKIASQKEQNASMIKNKKKI